VHPDTTHGDTNADGHDDALAHAMTWTAPDDHLPHPPEDPIHHDPGHVDTTPGH
jgi:hypothetical protein